jgi:hypothetical protein
MTFSLFSSLRGRDLPRNPYDLGNVELPFAGISTTSNLGRILRVKGMKVWQDRFPCPHKESPESHQSPLDPLIYYLPRLFLLEARLACVL